MNILKRKSCQLTHFRHGLMVLALYSTLLAPLTVLAESADELMQAAKAYILTHLEPELKQPKVIISPLSSTAKKPSCEKPLIITYNGKQRVGNITITLSCEQPVWRQYISAKVTGLLPVLVAQQDLNAGQSIDESMIRLEWRANAQVTPNHLRDLTSLAHKSTRQFIAQGSLLQYQHLKDSVMINKNDLVKIISADPRFRIEMNGMALEAGTMGQAIRVKNLSSGKIIKAYVESADSVNVR